MDPATEPLEYRDAAPLLAAVTGRLPSRSTYARYARVGTQVNGRTVKLPAVRRGGRWVTTRAWVQESVEAVKTGHLNRTV